MTRKKAMTTTPATSPPLTHTGRPKMPKMDVARIRTEESLAVTRTLDSIEDPTRRLVKASRIIAAAESFLDDATDDMPAGRENHMRKLALSLAVHDGALSVERTIGISRYGFYRMKAAAKRVSHHRNALEVLPQLAEQVYAARIRREVATLCRDELIVELTGAGMTHAQAADLTGLTRSRVTQIVSASKKDGGAEPVDPTQDRTGAAAKARGTEPVDPVKWGDTAAKARATREANAAKTRVDGRWEVFGADDD